MTAKTSGFSEFEADRDPVEAGISERGGPTLQQRPVGCHGQVADPEASQALHDIGDVRTQQRLTAGEANLRHPQGDEGPGEFDRAHRR